MPEYDYPKLSPNWDFWIITMNVELKLGKKPEYVSGSAEEVVLAFRQALTDAEKHKLDTVMGDVNVGLAPSTTEGHTIFMIKDIWDYRKVIEQATGKRVKLLLFPPPLPDGSHIMELWVEGKLSPSEIVKVKRAYGKLISDHYGEES